jgi:hypothetical protein
MVVRELLYGRGKTGIRPIFPVVVIAEDGDRTETATREVRQHAASLVEGVPAAIGDQVTRVDDDIRLKCVDAPEGFDDVVVVDLRPDVEIAQLDKTPSREQRWQIGDGEIAINEFQPVGLDAPGVESG